VVGERIRHTSEISEPAPRGVPTATVVAGAALALGALLPWADVSAANGRSFTEHSVAGANHGWLMVAIGVLVVAIVALVRAPRTAGLLTALAGAVALGFAVDDWLRMQRVVEHAENVLPAPVSGSVGIGLVLTVITALAVVVLSVWTLVAAVELRPSPSPRRRHA
jgi:uncharacterized membrane protein YidH (DUF202 family)